MGNTFDFGRSTLLEKHSWTCGLPLYNVDMVGIRLIYGWYLLKFERKKIHSFGALQNQISLNNKLKTLRYNTKV